MHLKYLLIKNLYLLRTITNYLYESNNDDSIELRKNCDTIPSILLKMLLLMLYIIFMVM